MKRVLVPLLLCLFCVQFISAQGVPQGMKYQAVARDASGQVIANQDISLMISLFSKVDRTDAEYKEIHDVTTNTLGLFTLTVGEGAVVIGDFSSIPWSTHEIWMEVAIWNQSDDDYVLISKSKMLSVPYAFHASTASELVSGSSGSTRGAGVPDPGVKSDHWSVSGNLGTDPEVPYEDKLGTMDAKDMVIVTAAKPRLRIYKEGNIDMYYALSVGEALTVDGDVDMNTRRGSTRNHGSFTVTNSSPTWLSGVLMVDGITDLNDRLNVNNQMPTSLSGNLTVDGATRLNNSLTVYNQSPTLLSGSLTVDKATDLNSSLNVDGRTDLNSALNVNYGSPTTLSGGLGVLGNASFGQRVVLENPAFNSTSASTGALVVHGGVGIGENLNVGGASSLGNLSLSGPLIVSDATPSSSYSTGAAIISGGVGIAKELNVAGKAVFGTHVLPMTGDYPVIVQGGTNGIAIKITGGRSGANDFVSFHDNYGQWGAIEGQTISELVNEAEYDWETAFLHVEGVIVGAEIAVVISDGLVAVAELVQAGIQLGASSTSSTACAGAGACITAPIPSFIVSSTAEVILKSANVASSLVNTTLVIANGVLLVVQSTYYDNLRRNNIGVTYSSGAGDYAEWLPKADLSEKFDPGDVVGVQGGFISKNTTGAEYVMAISSMPIVLGNRPQENLEDNFEKVAFMGQVPVKVFGPVQVGDYILPSGKHNGYGVAVSPQNMSSEDYTRIVGVAWTPSHSQHVGMVTVAVGLNANDVTRIVVDQEKRLDQQEAAVADLKAQVDELSALLVGLATGESKESLLTKMEWMNQVASTPEEDPGHTHVYYYEVTEDDILKGYDLAKSQLRAQGVNVDEHFFFQRLDSDPAQKQKIIEEIKIMADRVILEQYEVDKASGAMVELTFTPVEQTTSNGLQHELIKMAIQASEEKLTEQGVNTEDHPFFKKLKEGPEGLDELATELEHLLENGRIQ